MATLYLTLKKKAFDVMVTGEKTKEYRGLSDWIFSRLEGKEYDTIKFVNGYGSDRPSFECEYLGYDVTETATQVYSNGLVVPCDVYVTISLGKVLSKSNLTH